MNRNYIKKYASVLLALFFALGLSSCIDEETEDCGSMVKVFFDYSYNMLSINALEEQADQLHLYVFDVNGKLVQQKGSIGQNLSNNYSEVFPNLELGKYTLVAWAKSSNLTGANSDFSIPELVVGTSTLNELTYYLKRESGVQNVELNNFLVGYKEIEVSEKNGNVLATINLKKVNKKVRVVLMPYTGGTELDVNKYDFRIIDNVGNGHVNYDYSLLSDEAITYLPYYAANVFPQPSEVLDPTEVDKAAVVEINTSRIVDANKAKLLITNKEGGEVIMNVNLPWFLSLTGMESHKNWSLQEYLDRQDEYVITLFFNDETWLSTTIIINGWVINNIDIEM